MREVLATDGSVGRHQVGMAGAEPVSGLVARIVRVIDKNTEIAAHIAVVTQLVFTVPPFSFDTVPRITVSQITTSSSGPTLRF